MKSRIPSRKLTPHVEEIQRPAGGTGRPLPEQQIGQHQDQLRAQPSMEIEQGVEGGP
jgi:hypothetical protein